MVLSVLVGAKVLALLSVLTVAMPVLVGAKVLALLSVLTVAMPVLSVLSVLSVPLNDHGDPDGCANTCGTPEAQCSPVFRISKVIFKFCKKTAILIF